MIIAETERLWLREATEAEAAFILELLNTPAWLQFIGDRDVHTPEAARAYLENGAMRSYRENGFGSYCLVLKENGATAGMCGLHLRKGLPHTDLGFALLPQFEGKGYAREASEAIIRLARERWNLPAILAITSKDNTRSMNLLRKLGFHQQGDITLPEDSEALNCFELKLA